MVTCYLVEFIKDSGSYKVGDLASLDKDKYKVHKKSVRILRTYSFSDDGRYLNMIRK